MAPKATQLAKNSHVCSDPKWPTRRTTTQSFHHSESPLARQEVAGVEAATSCEPVAQNLGRATALEQESTAGRAVQATSQGKWQKKKKMV